MRSVFLYFVLICTLSVITTVKTNPCVKKCEWTPWSSWSECDKQCAGGRQKRSREYCCDKDLEIEDCMTDCGHRYSDMESGFDDTKGCNEYCYNDGNLTTYFSIYSTCQCPPRYSGTCCKNVVTCGRPNTVSHGSFSGNDFTYAGKIEYTCDKNYNMTDTLQSSRTCNRHGVWTGSAPTCLYAVSCNSNPCQNGASCMNLLGDYRCECLSGWSGKNCEVDIQPPIVHGCPVDRNIVTSNLTSMQSWSEPNITDPHGKDVTVSKNYPKSVFKFPWGMFTIQYNAVKPSNGLRAECKFNISIKPFPCKKIVAPTNGMIICNGWRRDYSQLCIFTCKQNYTLPPGYKADDIYVCGATGNWLPVNPVPRCVSRDLFPMSQVQRFTTCTSPSDKKTMSEFYVDFLKKSALNSLCEDHPDDCKPEKVNIRC